MHLPFFSRAADDELTGVARQRVAQLTRPRSRGAGRSWEYHEDAGGPFGGWIPRVPEQNPLTAEAAADVRPHDDVQLAADALASETTQTDETEPGDALRAGTRQMGGRYAEGRVHGGGVVNRLPLPVRVLWERWAPLLSGARVELGRGQIVVVLLVLGVGLVIAAVVYGLGRPEVTPVVAEVLATGTPAALEDAAGQPAAEQAGVGDGAVGDGAVADGAVADRPTDAASISTGDASATSGSLVVHVAGKVARPGVITLPVGSRVVDAIEAVGGADKGVDLTPLNLARVLADGEQVLVGVDPPPGQPPTGDGGAGDGGANHGSDAGESGSPINLNMAAQEQLETLPGVGPTIAQRIIEWREQNGGFTSIDELNEVSGIGAAKFADISPLVTV